LAITVHPISHDFSRHIVYRNKYEPKNSTKKKESSLVLTDFLYPGETIVFQSNRIESLSDHFFFYITDQRILLYRRRGVLFKKDRIIAERIEDIRSMRYGEMGILRKRGILCIETLSKKMDPIVGKVADIKAIWQEMQKYLRRDQIISETERSGSLGQTHQTEDRD
jgi:hypothetical protein